MNHRAFTLIELLVVIAVIAVLLGILLPALAAARSRARATKCLEQSRQIAVALTAFTADNRGRLPANRTAQGPDSYTTWRHEFVQAGYVPAPSAFACPDHPGRPLNEIGGIDNGRVCRGDVESSYALNGHLVWRLDTTGLTADRPEANIARPYHTILLAESRAPFPDIRVISELLADTDQEGRGLYGFWHSGQGTWSFSDGHAEHAHFFKTGNPDCRWHNGKDLTSDPFEPQDPREHTQHDHPDWQYLIGNVYRR